MKGFQEDWSQESMPLQKSKEPKGKDLMTKVCPDCNQRVIFINGQFTNHHCTSKQGKKQ